MTTGNSIGLEWGRKISNRSEKEVIAQRVANIAAAGDVVGVGSGSTSFLTVLALGQRVQNGLVMTAVPTSLEIELACHAVGLPVTSMVPEQVDWCFDGADEVDPSGRLIKGRGGALHRERHMFGVAKKRYVVADPSKSVEILGSKFPVPVEVDPSMILVALEHLQVLPHVTSANLRMAVAKDGPVITEPGKVIVDVHMSAIDDDDEAALLAVPGVCCTGIFSGFSFERL